MLLELNYITVVQRHVDGHLNICDYYLNDTPDVENAASKTVRVLRKFGNLGHDEIENLEKSTFSSFGDPKNQDSINQDTINPHTVTNGNLGHDKIKNLEKSTFSSFGDPKNQDTINQDTINPHTNTNNKINNNVYKYQSIHPSITKAKSAANIRFSLTGNGRPQKEMDGLMDTESELEAIVFNEMRREKTIPRQYMDDYPSMQTAVRIVTEYHYVKLNYEAAEETDRDEFRNAVFHLFNNALTAMLTAKAAMQLNNMRLTREMVYDKLVEYVKYENSKKYGEFFSMQDLLDNATGDFERACAEKNQIDGKIKNSLKYMQACIWSAMQAGNSNISKPKPRRS
jgi:hypothetical protein